MLIACVVRDFLTFLQSEINCTVVMRHLHVELDLRKLLYSTFASGCKNTGIVSSVKLKAILSWFFLAVQ